MHRVSSVSLCAMTAVAIVRVAVGQSCSPNQCPGAFQLRTIGDATTIQIPLTWESVPGATGYILERSRSGDFSPTSTGAIDETGANTGSLVGGYTSGVPGALGNDSNNALFVDGSTGFVNVGSGASIDITYKQNGLTLEAWFNVAFFPPDATIIGKARHLSANRESWANYDLDVGEWGFRYWTGDGGWNVQTWNMPLAVGTWYHVVLTHDTDGTVYLWVNGVRQAMRTNTTTPISSGDPAAIASQNGLAPVATFSGSLDEVAIYSHVLSDARIQAHYNSRNTGTYAAAVLADAPAAYWRLGDGGATGLTLSAVVNAYGDTGRSPDDRCRFHADNSPCPSQPRSPMLADGLTYTYRVRAQLPSGEVISNCVSAQRGGAPVRGVAGDLWADVVLGKPDFGQNAAVEPAANWLERPDGVLIDKHSASGPNRVYIADVNHNRILGFDHIGHCGDGQLCTVDADCSSGPCTLDNGSLRPSVLLGQDSFTGKSACNGDGTGQLFPARSPASASSLCLIPPLQISIGEVVFGSMMDTDDSGALYVPDLYNNRVLRYDDPFDPANGASAVAAIGQDDFAGNACDKGLPLNGPIDCRMLCLEGDRHAGVAIDHEGNLWVADVSNHRVLRFPKCPRANTSVCSGVNPGEQAKEADVVLGQSSCTTRNQGGATRGLDQFFLPTDVAFDRVTRTLYVADAGDGGVTASRILRFTPSLQTGDFSTGMPGVAVPISLPQQSPSTPPQLCASRPIEITLDTNTQGLWVRYDGDPCVELVDVNTGQPSLRLPAWGGPLRGVDVDRQGNLFVVDTYDYLFRFRRADMELVPEGQRASLREPVFVHPAGGWFDAGWIPSTRGVAVLSDPNGTGGDQLIIASWNRLLIYNNFDASVIQSGAPADDLFGEPTFTSASQWPQQEFAFPQVVGNQLWVTRSLSDATDLLVFSYPVSGASTPAVIPLTQRTGFNGYPVLGCPGAAYCDCGSNGQGCSGSLIYASGGPLDFTANASADSVWVADRWTSRVFRIAHLSDPGSRHVDVVLGQGSLAQTQCNRGGSGPHANTLCAPYSVSIDGDGNLYVTDNGFEGGTNHRLLEFDAGLFGTTLPAVFGPPATRVFGTGGDFDINGYWAASDPLISPFKAILHPQGPLTVGSNPYPSTQRFPVVYLNPLNERLPQLILGDVSSYPDASGAVDKNGNLYIADPNWSRVLIYKSPFQSVPSLLLTSTPTPSPTPMSSPTPTPTAVSPVCGNGILENGEQCDDGNPTNGDGCSATCRYELIAGNSSGTTITDRRACVLEWAVVNPHNVPPADSRGRPRSIQTCTDNDPTCDSDLDPNSHTCEFHVVACLNNVDPYLPGCPPRGVADPIRIRRPHARSDANYTALTTALRNLRNPATGETGLAPPVAAADTDLCTPPFPVRVRLRGTTRLSAARAYLRTLSKSLVGSPRPVSDVDTLTLICQP